MSGSDDNRFQRLSDDSKAILGGLFLSPMTEVCFHMRESRPTARCKAALDECVLAGAIS